MRTMTMWAMFMLCSCSIIVYESPRETCHNGGADGGHVDGGPVDAGSADGGSEECGLIPPPGAESCGGFIGLSCPAGKTCVTTDFDLCHVADISGYCLILPEECPSNGTPVCGCDGQTYGSACEAGKTGIAVLSCGPCAVVSGAPH